MCLSFSFCIFKNSVEFEQHSLEKNIMCFDVSWYLIVGKSTESWIYFSLHIYLRKFRSFVVLLKKHTLNKRFENTAYLL